MQKPVSIMLVAAGVLVAFADPNPVNQPVPQKKSSWSSSASLGVTLTRGNSDTTLVTAKILTDRKNVLNEWSFGVDGAYGENSGIESTESVHGFGQWNHLFSDQFFTYARVEGLHDGIADIKYRFTIGPGAGYYFLKETNTTLSAEAGGAAIFQRLGTVDNSYATLRLAEHFEHKFAAHAARFWQSAEFLPEADRPDNYIINAEVGIEAAIAKNLTLQSYLDDSYDSQPAAGRLHNDLKLVTAVSYKF